MKRLEGPLGLATLCITGGQRIAMVITITPQTTIGEAAMLLVFHKIGGLPVLEKECLVGIITETNVLEALAEIIGI